ncbi:hypothetical protein [Lysinibacillus sp. ACHW1.5]|uniref:hypothetical protein n=1 Tax=Lysinibacillus sp. ACHW1.5 TaxID=2913506 RepID=UPI001EDA1148|nr:hypothetical protein [Lysinibacillus sp. ACHW1.5]UKJ43457.1 hypothetical protein L6W14_11800 [Lysinibacillus sp. ACHW1.5]
MNIRKLLATATKSVELMYDREATVKRYEEYEKPNSSTGQKWITKHANVPCRLSTVGMQTLNNTVEGEANQILYDAKLFLSSTVDILAGDEIAVQLFEDGELIMTDEFTSAEESFLYVTHQEVLLKKKVYA